VERGDGLFEGESVSNQRFDVEQSSRNQTNCFRILTRYCFQDASLLELPTTYLIRITVLETDVDFVRAQMHEGELVIDSLRESGADKLHIVTYKLFILSDTNDEDFCAKLH
jgi:hypothetical protein